MHKLLLSTSAGVLALLLVGPASAQTWTLTPEQAQKMSPGQAAPATAAPTAPAKDETGLLKAAAAALENAQKLNPRPETENAIKTINSIPQKMAQMAPATPAVKAPDGLLALQKDPKQWVTPTGDYANTRYSSLN
jgi:hypothetical protein